MLLGETQMVCLPPTMPGKTPEAAIARMKETDIASRRLVRQPRSHLKQPMGRGYSHCLCLCA